MKRNVEEKIIGGQKSYGEQKSSWEQKFSWDQKSREKKSTWKQKSSLEQKSQEQKSFLTGWISNIQEQKSGERELGDFVFFCGLLRIHEL
jgi:hypothetical protein